MPDRPEGSAERELWTQQLRLRRHRSGVPNDRQQREDTRTLQQFAAVHDVFADTGTSCVLLLRSSHLRAQALLLLPQFGREFGTEVFGLEHLANLDLGLAGMGLGQRLTHSIASSFDFTCHIQKPAISSFVSANGPSMTVRFAPENLTRAPFELGWRPSPASITPALTSSSLNLPISARIFFIRAERPLRNPWWL